MCKRTGCLTRLSLYNLGDRCYIHTPDAVERELWYRLRLSPEYFTEDGTPTIELTRGEALIYQEWSR